MTGKTNNCCSVHIDETFQYINDYPNSEYIDLINNLVATKATTKITSNDNECLENDLQNVKPLSEGTQVQILSEANDETNCSNIESETEEIELNLDWDENSNIAIQKCSVSSFYSPQSEFDSEILSLTPIHRYKSEVVGKYIVGQVAQQKRFK